MTSEAEEWTHGKSGFTPKRLPSNRSGAFFVSYTLHARRCGNGWLGRDGADQSLLAFRAIATFSAEPSTGTDFSPDTR